MKKLTRKLFLSIAALAVCAATLVSTTFAWYVQNTEATASGMTASTAEATGDGSIYVSKDGNAFTKSVTITTSDYDTKANGELKPRTAKTNTLNDGYLEFYDVTGTKIDTGNAEEKNYIKFSVWVKSDKNITCTPKITVTNTTEEFTKQTAYQNITSTVTAGQEFFVDAVQALRMSIQVDSAETATIYDMYELAKANSYSLAADSVDETQLTMDAHEYYNLLMGGEPTLKDTDAASTTSTWAAFQMTGNTAVKLTFCIWLDGADKSCFDSCQGQDFNFVLSFSASAAVLAD